MVRIKRWLLIVIVILAVVAGAAAMCLFLDVDTDELVSGQGNYVRLSRASYDELASYKETYKKVDILRRYIKRNYYKEVSDEELMDGLYSGIFYSLDDPYSMYLTKTEYDNEIASLTGDYSGIGVTVAADVQADMIIVIAPSKGTPAEAAGLRAGDYIRSVDGVEYSASELGICAAAIRGNEGTDVTLGIVRKDESFDVTITRARIKMQSVSCEMRDDGIGYIQVSSFLNRTGNDFSLAVKDLESQGATGLIVDLRNNGGGLVDGAVAVADVLMDKATVVYTEDHDHNRYYYKTSDGKTDIPLVVLINGGTASASEILTAGLQDNGRCRVVGTKSFGKGVIQEVEELSDGSAIKLTVLQYFTPSGKVIHDVGITPDVVVELTDDCFDEDGYLVNDVQLERAAALLNSIWFTERAE